VSRVASRDGTKIAFWTSGQGPPLVVVHGAPADHTRWRPLLPHLEPHVTIHTIDRRGRGASADGPDYEITREFDDVAAVVDAIADASNSAVDLYGHSFGGLVAFGAATRTSNLRKLVLYEGWPVRDPSVFALPPGVDERLTELQRHGDREVLLETFMRDAAMVSDDDIQAMRALPSWQGRVDAALTLPRELRACLDARFDAQQAGQIKVPTLLLTGESSTDVSKADIDVVATALTGARIVVLAGQQHVADIMVPEVFAGHLLAFLRD
jgi:pimeloyl-ACP methyl ester carboxylesterase